VKTTKKEFDAFKVEFLRWVDRLGLQGYRMVFTHRRDDDNYATVETDERGKIAEVNFCSEFSEYAKNGYFGPKVHAKHEAIHLLLHRIYWLGQQRYLNSGELDDEWERLVRVLEKVLM